MSPAKIGIEDPDQPEIRALLEEADRYYATLYSANENFLLDISALQQPGIAFYVARDGGDLLGFGAVAARPADEAGIAWAEVKRMYVAPAARGRRVGRLILDRLLGHAKDRGIDLLRLETGNKQLEALSLYRSVGFANRGPFGDYPDNESSVYMELKLA
ncbi:GNAT family N-acetyltransferase [Dongia sp.]|uniref:GNAT family N-acetyltransferase n=1 Tax=Dongia sp. TaxID=1977262 RepID=UPI003752467E